MHYLIYSGKEALGHYVLFSINVNLQNVYVLVRTRRARRRAFNHDETGVND